MEQSATADTLTNIPVAVDEEDFKVLYDAGNVVVVQMNGVHVAQIQSPIDIGELSWDLAAEGFVAQEIIGFEDGIIEMLLRPLAETPDHVSDREKKIMSDIHSFVKEREGMYA